MRAAGIAGNARRPVHAVPGIFGIESGPVVVGDSLVVPDIARNIAVEGDGGTCCRKITYVKVSAVDIDRFRDRSIVEQRFEDNLYIAVVYVTAAVARVHGRGRGIVDAGSILRHMRVVDIT